jgi:hypothetical protein
LVLELDAAPRAYLDCVSEADGWQLRCWLSTRPDLGLALERLGLKVAA